MLYAVTLRGKYQGTFHYKMRQDAEAFYNSLSGIYDSCSLTSVELLQLPTIKIGDEVLVLGDGAEVYTVVEVFTYDGNKIGYTLNTGFAEMAHKVFKKRLDGKMPTWSHELLKQKTF